MKRAIRLQKMIYLLALVSFGPVLASSGTASPGANPPNREFSRRDLLGRLCVTALVLGGGYAAWKWYSRHPATLTTEELDAIPIASPSLPRLGEAREKDGWGFPMPTLMANDDARVAAAEQFLIQERKWSELSERFPHFTLRWVRIVDLEDAIRKELADPTEALKQLEHLKGSLGNDIRATLIPPRSVAAFLKLAWHQHPMVLVDDKGSKADLLLSYHEALYDREVYPQHSALPKFAADQAEGKLHPYLWSELVAETLLLERARIQEGFRRYLAGPRSPEREFAIRVSMAEVEAALLQVNFWSARERAYARLIAAVVYVHRWIDRLERQDEKARALRMAEQRLGEFEKIVEHFDARTFLFAARHSPLSKTAASRADYVGLLTGFDIKFVKAIRQFIESCRLGLPHHIPKMAL